MNRLLTYSSIHFLNKVNTINLDTLAKDAHIDKDLKNWV